jgi:pseudouridine-5'-phosphate glycosidase
VIPLPKNFVLSEEISRALLEGQPIVGLESTVITHGLPYPENLSIAKDMEAVVREENAIPAIVAVIEGRVRIGLDTTHLEFLAGSENLRKISSRDIAPVIYKKESGGTTVAGTLAAAEKVGIKVFATGGIGGVHRDAPFDISTDLIQLSNSPVIAVCAGAKSILDLPATLERLETLGIPVAGYQTDEFPAFYSRQSGLPLNISVQSAKDVADIAKIHWGMGFQSAVLVTVPPPEDVAVPAKRIEVAIQQALKDAKNKQIHGQAVTPFLLSRVNELTDGDSMKANLGLLKNNARVAALIAQQIYKPKRTQEI